MSCSAVGHGTIKYQWERYLTSSNEWIVLPTNQQSDIFNISIYTIENLRKENDGIYRCGASNIDGISYSVNATINVYGKEDASKILIFYLRFIQSYMRILHACIAKIITYSLFS